jgi:hypothetical protein
MSSLEKRSSGQLAINSLAPTDNPNDISWSENEDHLWWQFSDLPESVVAQFASDNLLPDTILLQSFPQPNRETKKVEGWLAGRNGFTFFTLIPSGKNQWTLIGRFNRFSTPAQAVVLDVSSDLSNGSKIDTSSSVGNGEDLEWASTLPSDLRKKLHAIKAKKMYISDTTRFGPQFPGKFSYTVDVATMNSTHFLAISATQQIEVYQGDTQAAVEKRIASAPWTAKVIYEKFA